MSAKSGAVRAGRVKSVGRERSGYHMARQWRDMAEHAEELERL